MSFRHYTICGLVLCICLAVMSLPAVASEAADGSSVSNANATVVNVLVYRDPDPAALALQPPPGGRNRYRHGLDRLIRENPLNAGALMTRGYWFAELGKIEESQRDFEAAMAATEDDPGARRSVLWSRGWARYDLGDTTGAIDDWSLTERMHGGRPFWVTYSYALAYWTLGDQPRALAWYDAAVASYPDWGIQTGMQRRTRHWRDNQQVQMTALFQAWQEAHPDHSGQSH